MLTVTDNAVAAIISITDQDAVPDGAGLRLATDTGTGSEVDAGSLALSLVPEPLEGDVVVDTSGARVFLDPPAAELLDDKALDARIDAEGNVQFTVAETGGAAGPG
jgi:iron-sulfur cluster assembly protein